MPHRVGLPAQHPDVRLGHSGDLPNATYPRVGGAKAPGSGLP
ncbi:MAG: hypothetical protein AVDCRST_MAG86-3274 [uncultured Truepera sp.]|uniref:Uncharacterized protein n=1 Tax=uncultured Truepera sp. TaxID=543023 RepID=A0A6J4VSP1_9DEIN|nr:MAG: hypothetical protein AVDCRST_MAG86-3274 [uncultured Truepera sp.]